ncbi:hypothetical protein CLV30_105240 [Haloactinopolyspora alba]|uniref:Uncharacterized protein n=1 Tax=Haloactinopolyspora alba TaxID=648780 RepID=A0A2P8E5M8_9ACTN|nr:DUF6069 family protein [Haloactinopolyspora alba]PSL04773.1 hypothetical protein CLV30_105240 [Haloactinopolyspora alba]
MTITTTSVPHLRIRRVVTVIAAVAAPALLWVIARAADADLTVDLRNGEPPMQVGLPIAVAFAAALLGGMRRAATEVRA